MSVMYTESRAHPGQLPPAQRLHVPEKTAVVYGERRYTYAELEERVNRLSSRLRDSGLQKGDRVAFFCFNTPPQLEAHFAVPGSRAGARGNKHPSSAKTRLRTSSSTRGRRMVFVDAELEELLADVDDGVRAGPRRRYRERPGDPYEDYLAEGSPEARGERAGGRGGDDLHKLHLGNYRAPKGRDVHPPRRLI
jgi:fatty-acyl-CoA synthase